MAIDTSAISNVGEFYSNHYLDAILDKDVKALIKSWEDAEGNGYVAPHKRLSAQAAKYFKLKSQLTHSIDQNEQYTISHEVNITLLEALGFNYQSNAYELTSEDGLIPVLCSLEKDGNPYLWIIDTYWDLSEEARLFDQKLLKPQKPKDVNDYEIPNEPLENIPALIFKKDEPPRWLLILSGGRAVLIERHKWGQGQYLEFDLDEFMARKNADNFKALAILLSKEALLPDGSNAIHDTLDENSHKHAYAVSSDLKYGIRRAVELLANEYLWYAKNYKQGKGLNREGLDKQLTSETLTYMYRLLFLFYAEARSGDLGLLPMNSDEYRMGYSIESLRDLELVKLNTEKAKSGYYLNDSLEKLFKLINEGHTPAQLEIAATDTVEYAPTQTGVFGAGEVAQGRLKMTPTDPTDRVDKRYTDYEFSIEALGSPLFDPAKTPTLSKAKFRNVVLQEIIQLLSLSKEGRGRNSGRGRISYAQLGINQLGAVYEGLLSYTGFFAKETLYEVKKADEMSEDENRQAYFIPESDIDKYEDDEFVRFKDSENPAAVPKRVKYDKGTYIYRLAGRDREKSASYYTPEVLTKAVVKYSLKELLKDKSADEILELTVCEPAMGSGAFLNEAVNQLADAYLQEKQKELGKEIPPAEYQEELQKVKAFIATQNCYGVDLNPTAVDLAKVSLWLNIIYKHSKTPWFSLRLSSGNSLIGARLEVFKSADLKSKRSKGKENYLDRTPRKADMDAGRAKDEVYHFFVPNLGMASFDKSKVIRGLSPDDTIKVKDWRKSFTQDFTDPQIQTLLRLSDKVDELLKSHLELRQRLLRETTDDTPIWPSDDKPAGISIPIKEKLENELYEGSSAYRKLKLVMDYWCSLWFWPIEKASQLPTRDQYIRDCELILEGKTSGIGAISNQTDLHFKPTSEIEKSEAENIDKFGVEEVIQESKRLSIVSKIISNIPFLHWELQYYEIYKIRHGFDLVLGNPPWVRVEWYDTSYLADHNPILGIRKNTSNDKEALRSELLKYSNIKNQYTSEYTITSAMQEFFSSNHNYPILQGKSNLFKCFIYLSWHLMNDGGVTGLLHPEGAFEDPRGGELRHEMYKRLRCHFQFHNELRLFQEVDHHTKYSINIYGTEQEIRFINLSNLYHPVTIEYCMQHDGMGMVEGVKDDNGSWNINGHSDRVIVVEKVALTLFAKLFDAPLTPYYQARLPAIHTSILIPVLQKLAGQKYYLSSLNGEYCSTTMWNETNAQKEGIIRRETGFVSGVESLIISGPHFHIGTPFYKTPRKVCTKNSHYDVIDHSTIPDTYLPRANYVYATDSEKVEEKTLKVSWKEDNVEEEKSVTEYYRFCSREMISPNLERTFIASIIPPKISHIITVVSIAFKDTNKLLMFGAFSHSLICDFYVKSTGQAHANISLLNNLPVLLDLNKDIENMLKLRTLMLNCLTAHYKELWEQSWEEENKTDFWTKRDERLDNCQFEDLDRCWDTNSSIRTEYARRQALVEIDVLTAIALGISIDELLTIYRTHFPVMRNYEQNTWYDRNGRIVYTNSKGLVGVGLDTAEWKDLKDLKSGAYQKTVVDDTLQEGPIELEKKYEAPFDRCDREADYRTAWSEFEKRLSNS